MLQRIFIKDYALIEELNVELDEGLNVITGETGAGKSIVIDALTLLLGYRGDKNNIRQGADKMVVQGLFAIPENKEVKALLSDYGIDPLPDELLLTRQMDRRGRNVCRADSIMLSVSQLRTIGNHLIDIHGQHEHQSLFQKENHRQLLDDFAGDKVNTLRRQISNQANQLKTLAGQIRSLEKDERELNRQKEMMLHESNEIKKASLEPNEEELLLSEKKVLENSEHLYNAASEAYSLLSGDEDMHRGITADLAELIAKINVLIAIDETFANMLPIAENALTELDSFAFELNSYIDNIDFDMSNLDEVEKRLAQIGELKRKYGGSVQEIIDYGKAVEDKIESLLNKDEELAKLQKEYKAVWQNYLSEATELHDLRVATGRVFKKELEKELADLSMEKAVVQVDVQREMKLISPKGQDQVEFLISVNPGIPPKPLRKIASGGEISRIMLSIKSIFGDKDRIQTMIFDEIDTGISGRTAQAVGEKIHELSKTHQIICITHLPQIAAMADKHFQVEKNTDTDSVEVNFESLDEESRVVALAKMLGGAVVTDKTMAHAREMRMFTQPDDVHPVKSEPDARIKNDK